MIIMEWWSEIYKQRRFEIYMPQSKWEMVSKFTKNSRVQKRDAYYMIY